jgi:hypothetical protein
MKPEPEPSSVRVQPLGAKMNPNLQKLTNIIMNQNVN